MKMQPIVIVFSALLLLSPPSVHAEKLNSLETKADSCALLKPDDLTTLLGGTPTAKPSGDSCSWTASDSTSNLITIKYASTGMAAEMAFASARKNAAKGGTVTDEAGLGDKAFARLGSTGVVLIMIKQGRLLQMQYKTGAAGTAKDLDALRPVAKKAIEAY